MNLLLLFPLVAALIGWLIASLALNLFFKSIPARKAAIASNLSKTITTELLPSLKLEEKLSSPDSFRKLLPTIEEHIDEFLRHKIGKSMPYLSMFVGDKTIQQLKELFMEELADIFPIIMKKYVGTLQQEINLNDVLQARLAAISPERIRSLMKETLGKELRMVKMTGALIGFVVAVIQLLFNAPFII